MAKKNNPAVNDQDIVSLKGADRVRKRPAVMFGSDGLEGCEHAVFEILSNSVDEAREGFGNLVKITVFEDHSIEIEDFGRGVPLDYNEKEGKYNWELVFCELYAGGKYNNNSEDSAYQYSIGTNGLGACATQYSSEYMTVKSYSNGYLYEMDFKKGEPVGDLRKRELEKREKKSGTVIRWKPDIEVFTDIRIPLEYFIDVLKRQSVVNGGLKFILRWQKGNTFEEYTFLYENGIADYIKEIAGDDAMTLPVVWSGEGTGRDRDDKNEYKLKLTAAYCASNRVKRIEYYHNSSFLTQGGSPEKAVKSAFVYAVDKYLKTNGKYNKNESKISFSDVEDCMILIINSFSTEASYANQTKLAVTNTFIAEFMTDFFKKSLEIYFAENPMDAEKICAQVLINKRSRETAENTRLNIKKKLVESSGFTNRVEKFVNCRSKDPDVRELYIVEGDSALTSCKLGRAAEFQAIIPVRGKTLNCLKSTYDRIFKNEIIVNLLRVIGCGVELHGRVKTDMPPFDIDNLKWNKIIICTDADEDGFQIRTLILTLFHRLLPSLISYGKVFIAESPLFEITCGDDEIYFAYSEAEKVEIISRLGNKKYTLQRSKGLGENEPDMMWQTTMNPATRRLVAVSPADKNATDEMFELMLGDNLNGRKEFIRLHGSDYVAVADY